MGSEMCIRDRFWTVSETPHPHQSIPELCPVPNPFPNLPQDDEFLKCVGHFWRPPKRALRSTSPSANSQNSKMPEEPEPDASPKCRPKREGRAVIAQRPSIRRAPCGRQGVPDPPCRFCHPKSPLQRPSRSPPASDALRGCADAPRRFGAQSRPQAALRPVSYTHLTLPTICSV